MSKILIVEDDYTMNKLIQYNLKDLGKKIDSVYNGKDALELLEVTKYDLLILDVNLPYINGWKICKEATEKDNDIAVIFLTVNDLDEDIIKGYKLGAVDYITKPFSVEILKHKIKAILSVLGKSSLEEDLRKVFDDGYLKINFNSLESTIDGKFIDFTPMEYRMLELLIENNKVVLTRQMLLDKLWDSRDKFVDEHTLTSLMSRIRQKIEKQDHKYIKTVYGMGYMWIGGGTNEVKW